MNNTPAFPSARFIKDFLFPDSLPARLSAAIAKVSQYPPSIPVEGVELLIRNGEQDTAFAISYVMIMQGNTDPRLPFLLGGILYQQGDIFKARAIFRKFTTDMPARDDTVFEPVVHRAFYESVAFSNEKMANILLPDSFFGPYDAPGPAQKRIETFLEGVFSRQDVFALPMWEEETTGILSTALPEQPRALIGTQKYLDGSELCPPFHMPEILQNSARQAGVDVAFHAMDRLIYDCEEADRGTPYLNGVPYRKSPELRAEEVKRLEERIAEFRPHLLVIDLSFAPTANTLQPEDLVRFRETYGVGIIGLLFDDHAMSTYSYTAWESVVDGLASFDIFNSKGRHSPHWEKYFSLFPCADTSDSSDPSMSRPTKEFDFVFSGQPSRYRNVWLNAMLCSGLSCSIATHIGHANSTYATHAQYMDLMGRGKITFNTGYWCSSLYAQTSRPSEAILNRCLLMEEDGSHLSSFFMPYIHYIPVRSVHELVHFSRFLCEREDWRERITDAAYEHHVRQYSGPLLWARFFSRVAH